MRYTRKEIEEFVDRLDIVREGIEAGLDDWPLASQIYEYKTAAEIIIYLWNRSSTTVKE